MRNPLTARRVILLYAVGIWAYCGLHVIIRAFYSMKDTVTPVKVGIVCVGIHRFESVAYMGFAGGGLALSTAISAIAHIIILTVILQKGFV